MSYLFYVSLLIVVGATTPPKEKSADTRRPFPAPIQIPQELIDEAPPQFLCPISHEVMTQPCFAGGRTYERDSILRWVQQNQTDPLTREPLTINDLQPDYNVRSAIEEWISSRRGNSN